MLPIELVLYILEYISREDIFNLIQVNRELQSICQDESIWRKLTKKNFPRVKQPNQIKNWQRFYRKCWRECFQIDVYYESLKSVIIAHQTDRLKYCLEEAFYNLNIPKGKFKITLSLTDRFDGFRGTIFRSHQLTSEILNKAIRRYIRKNDLDKRITIKPSI